MLLRDVLRVKPLMATIALKKREGDTEKDSSRSTQNGLFVGFFLLWNCRMWPSIGRKLDHPSPKYNIIHPLQFAADRETFVQISKSIYG